MKFFLRCEKCKKRALIVKKRVYDLPQPAGLVTSKSLLCHKCYREVKKVLEGINLRK